MGNLVSGREISAGGVMSQPPQGVMGMETGIGGDQISGKWINSRTGRVVYARQLIDNGGEALVVTDSGVIPMSQFVEFVQMSEEEYAAPSNQSQVIPQDNGMSDEDRKLLAGLNNPKPKKEVLPSLDEPLTKQTKQVVIEQKSTIEVETESPNHKMIDKVFKKFGSLKIKVDIDWQDFPKDKLDSLIDIFDVPKEEIAEYIIKEFCSVDKLKETVSERL